MHLTWSPGDPVVHLTFLYELNVSVQIGDVAYFSNSTPVGSPKQWAATSTPHMTSGQEDIKMIGEIVNIGQWNGTFSSITCNMPQVLYNNYYAELLPPAEPFIMFSKDNKTNLSSLLGYYAKVEFKNNSTDEAELFSVGSEIFESSK
jgi:hypothetical protein